MANKISFIGAGNVGSQAAFYCALKELGEIVMIDIAGDMAKGKALDLLEAMPVALADVKISGGSDYAMTKGSDVIVITAGVPRKPGMTRDDLIQINSNIMKSIIPEVVKYSPESILIIVSNPLDAMVRIAYDLSGFPKERVIGMAGILDSARFRTFICEELNVSVKDVEAMVLGGHGDSMVPLGAHCTVKGRPVSELMPKEKLDGIIKRTQDGGAEIVGLLKTGSAFFAPGLSAAQMVEAILKDLGSLLPCCALLEGEYGYDDVFIGVPVKLGKEGVKEIVELELTAEEKSAFANSVEHVKELVSKL